MGALPTPPSQTFLSFMPGKTRCSC
uniref:Uncharacterized protein n=1 Tax=Rhizophora mucronata TaxID=61149 RepID=A0A2P2MYS2_RHIMU